jgi:hypothetical protein
VRGGAARDGLALADQIDRERQCARRNLLALRLMSWAVSPGTAPLRLARGCRHLSTGPVLTSAVCCCPQPTQSPYEIDLLHPLPSVEASKHKLKRLVQTPNSFFMDVKCPGCFNMCVCFRERACFGRLPSPPPLSSLLSSLLALAHAALVYVLVGSGD